MQLLKDYKVDWNNISVMPNTFVIDSHKNYLLIFNFI